MNRIKRWIRGYFGFSRTETNGLLLLLPLTLAVIAAAPFYRYLASRSGNNDFSQESAFLDSLRSGWQADSSSSARAVAVERFAFNPNTATAEQFQKLGLSPRVVQTILHYRERGGKFRIKADVKKIYGLEDSTYKILAPWIQLPDHRDPPRHEKKTIMAKAPFSPKPKIEPFDLNLADTAELKSIRGIGEVLSERIVRYRTLLGGFVKEKQLDEVYGLDSTVIARLESKAYIAHGYVPHRININKATDSALAHHPYISYRVARALVAFRFQHGPYKSVDEIQNIELIDDQLAGRIEPYLTTSNR